MTRSFKASHSDVSINLDSLEMVSVQQWPGGEWKASGWWRVWHLGDKQATVQAALKDLIDKAAAYAKDDEE